MYIYIHNTYTYIGEPSKTIHIHIHKPRGPHGEVAIGCEGEQACGTAVLIHMNGSGRARP